jgi:serine protease Do
VDIRGQLVGINSFFITQGGGSEGLGFAIPSRLVKFVYETIRRTGRVSWADIGVRVQGVTPTLSLGLRLPRDSGVVVSDVIPGTAAEQLGIKAGDFLSTIDGQPVENLPKYYEVMYHKGMGDKVALNLIRDSHRISLEIPITASMGDVDHAAAESNPPSNLVPKLGILCSEVGTMPRIETAQLRSKTGVLVEAKAVGGDMQANLMAGDVIHSVNLTSISNVAQLQTVLDQVKSGTPIVLQVERKSQFLYVPVDEN